MILEDGLLHRPGRFDRFLAREKSPVADHCVAQEPLVGRLLSRLFFGQVGFSLVADEILPGSLDSSSAPGMCWRSGNRGCS